MSILAWAALLAALSPVLLDLVEHWWVEPWARYSLLFVPLLCERLLRSPSVPRHRDGVLWVVLAAAIELAAIAGTTLRIGRVAIALGVVGVSRLYGTAATLAVVLVFWIVPVPTLVLRPLGPLLAAAWTSLLSPVGHGLGVDVAGGLAALDLSRADVGPPLMALLSGLGWYAGLRRGGGWSGCLARAAAGALAALPLTALGLLIAAALSGALGSAAGRLFLDHVWWLLVAVGGLWAALRGPGAREVGRE